MTTSTKHSTQGGDSSAAAERPLSLLDIQILGVLAHGELHGYGIAREIQRRDPDGPRILPTNLYRRLHELAARGLLAEAGVQRDASGRERRNFALTDAGRAALVQQGERLARIVEQLDAASLPSPPSGSE